MKKFIRISAIVLGILSLVAIIWIASILYLFTGVHQYEPDPVFSPDGSKAIIPTINYNKDKYDTYLLVHIEIQDIRTGKTLFQVQTRASDRMRWDVKWIENDSFQLDSSDIGLYCWKEMNNTWMEINCP